MRSKRILYVPGMISLIGIPLLFVLLNVHDPVKKVVLKMNLPTDAQPVKGVETFSRNYVLKNLKNKKIVRIYFEDETPDNEIIAYRNSAKRKFLIDQMAQLQFSGDTTKVLQVELGAESTYGNFIELLNLAAVYNCERYFYIDDSYYFLANPASERLYLEDFGLTSYYLEGYVTWQPPTAWELFTERLKIKLREAQFYILDNLLVCIGFFALIIIPSLVRLYKKRYQVKFPS